MDFTKLYSLLHGAIPVVAVLSLSISFAALLFFQYWIKRNLYHSVKPDSLS